MTPLAIICITIVLIMLIAGVVSAVEKCSYYKWRATNPEAFKWGYEEYDAPEEEEEEE